MRTDILNHRIRVNTKKCLTCHSCEVGCAVSHSKSKNFVETIGEENKSIPRIVITQKKGKISAIFCQHCKNAPCITVCPEGAMVRISDEGPVILEKDKCTGCGECISVCPFVAIKKSSDGKGVIKCDLCMDRLKEGEDPACVENCPTGAIRYVLINKKISVEKGR